MAKLDVPPTKSSLLRLKRDLRFAREGYEMLEEKRQILILELMGTVQKAKGIQREVQEKLDLAFGALREALIRNGALRLTSDAGAPRPEHSAEVSARALMGIYLPTISADHPAAGPATSLMAADTTLDEVTAAFAGAMESIDRLAEIENAVFRLAREVRKTQRRVNALEKMFIPSYIETLRFITDALEERERDEFIVMRKVKERLEKKR
jgi:V/A-type H+-transporting ATPase subunit D